MAQRPDLRELLERARHSTLHAAEIFADRVSRAFQSVAESPKTKCIASAGATARVHVTAAFSDIRKQAGRRIFAWLDAVRRVLSPWMKLAGATLRRIGAYVASAIVALCAPALHALAAQPRAKPIVDAWPLTRSCIAMAAANLFEYRLRLLAALSGVAVALFLLILQISVLDAASAKVTALYDDFDFDIAIVPDTYQFLLSFDTINKIDLNIAKATGDVADTFGLNVSVAHWTELPSNDETYNFIVGIDKPGRFITDRDIRSGWAHLTNPHAILADRYSEPTVGPVSVGTDAEINGQRVNVVGQFKLGLFFYAEGAAVVRNIDFAHLVGRDSQTISIGLVRLKPGISSAKAKADLIKALPTDTLVLTRAELLHNERDYFLSTKPIGIMIYISMIIACLVAVAIIVQVLTTDVSNRMNEYAVLKAMGASLPFVYGVGLAQAGLLGLGALAPAVIVGAAVLGFIQYRTHLGTAMGPFLIAEMIVITLALAVGAAAAVVRRVQRADPAELF
jgi:putative ABC transport system permease protein